LVRGRTAAFSRKQRQAGDEIAVKEDVAEKKPDEDKARTEGKAEAKPAATPDAKAERKSEPKSEAKSDVKSGAKADVKSGARPDVARPDVKSEAKADVKSGARPDVKSEAKADVKSGAKVDVTLEARSETNMAEPAKDLPAIEPPTPNAEPWPDATPTPMKPVEPGDAVRNARTQTVTIPAEADLGRPPDMPRTSAPPPLALGAVEDPTHMPGPKDVPNGNPSDPAPPPGRVPPGDSRSLRRAGEFALVYRVGTCVITRTGTVGTRGQWRVVEYPTASFASSSYAKECSRFVSEGFSDYRE
jgi:hypothetical protein